MPVTTDTFWNIKKLNVVFAASALILLGSCLWMLKADHDKSWRKHQQDGTAWDAFYTYDAAANAVSAYQKKQLRDYEKELAEAQVALKNDDTLRKLNQELKTANDEKSTLDLPLRIDKGDLTPIQQRIERAELEKNEKALREAREEYAAKEAAYRAKAARMADLDKTIAEKTRAIDAENEKKKDYRKRIDDIERKKKGEEDKLKKLDPQGLGPKFAEKFRNAPLSDWFNPSEKVQQVVVPDIRTDMNFLTVETIDRCQTCHVHIDDPRYDEKNLLAFVERQVALFEGQETDFIEEPVVMLGFWEKAVEALDAPTKAKLKEVRGKALESLNTELQAQGEKPVADADMALDQALIKISEKPLAAAPIVESQDDPKLAAWREEREKFLNLQRQLGYYRADVQKILRERLDKKEFTRLMTTYRHALVARLNKFRADNGQKPLDASSVMMAHPDLHLYVEAESKHPMKLMGCTVCHEGSGQETEFEHTAHTPSEVWVDAATGAKVPEFLLTATGTPRDMKQRTTKPQENVVSRDSLGPQKAAAAHGAAESKDAHAHGDPAAHGDHGGHALLAKYTHADVKLTDPHNPAPFAPHPHPHDSAAAYLDPATGMERVAVRQAEFWTKKHHWAEVHYMHWEKPMHDSEYIESSCSRCHSAIFDVAKEAPRLFEGRKLFSQLGCVNCHLAEQITKDSLDIKKVGPSLVNVKDKLPADMIASWIWSPKAFRPMSRMPHFFMLENNSTPIDILRTRTEVAAMTHYLQHAESAGVTQQRTLATKQRDLAKEQQALNDELATNPKSTRVVAINERLNEISNALAKLPAEFSAAVKLVSDYKADYKPDAPPAAPGDAAKGRDLFLSVGCMACHTNMAEYGQKWITEDLIKRTGASPADAQKKFAEMDYNQQQWYALEHLKEKIVLVGPELSGVATKLIGMAPKAKDANEDKTTADKRADRTKKARTWLYDWVRHPRHYSSYTIMPDFRLSEAEANDLAAYLLTLERPGYTPEDFLNLDEEGKLMLGELVASLGAGEITVGMSRRNQLDKPEAERVEQQLNFLGKKMLTNYGCTGCHVINGLETATRAGAQLDDWGLKDPHKLDFGYFDHAFDKNREKPIQVTKVAHEGLAANAPQINHKSDQIAPRTVAWEEMHLERRPWIYNKLHNTRVYDRGRTMLESPYKDVDSLIAAIKDANDPRKGFTQGDLLGKPYDKLKMPKFFLKDEEVRSIATFVTSLRVPLTSDGIRQKTYTDARMRLAHGRQLATMYNCYGCHNIDGNEVQFHQYLPVFKPDGSKDYNKLNDFAPPRLVGEGARVQPDWLHGFLLDVHEIRPWLQIRMPSFPVHDLPEREGSSLPANAVVNDNASHLSEYFAAGTQLLEEELTRIVVPLNGLLDIKDLRSADGERLPVTIERIKAAIETYNANQKGDPARPELPPRAWFENPKVARQIAAAKQFAIENELAKTGSFDLRESTLEDQAETWSQLLYNLNLLRDTYHINYPFPAPARPPSDPDSFERGKQLFAVLDCKRCHDIGDPELLKELAKLAPKPATPAPAAAAEDEGYGEETPAAAKPAAAADDEGYGEEAPAVAAPTEVTFTLSKPGVTLGGPGFAPNLGQASRRMQYNWVKQWVEAPGTMHPGTRMPLFFEGGASSTAKYPAERKKEIEPIVGYTAEQQRRFLLDYLYTAGEKNYTPGAEKLYGKPEPAPKKLPPLAPPAEPKTLAAIAPLPTDTAATTKPTAGASTGGAAKPTTPAAPVEEATKSVIELPAGATAPLHSGTRVVGVVKFSGQAPPRKPIDMNADPACHAAHTKPSLDPTLIVNPDQSIRNVFIYVKSGLKPEKYQPPPAALLDQVGCEYRPHVLGLMTGQQLKIRNSDQTSHNVHLFSNQKSDFNKATGPGVVETLKLTKPEMAATFKCDIHPWMNSWVYVLPHPFFTVSDVEGRYEIKNLPPGKYTLEAVHELQGDKRNPVPPVTFEVEVADKTTVRADVTVKK